MKIRTSLLLMLFAILVPAACLSVLGLSMLLQSERDTRLRGIEEMANSTSLLIDGEIASAQAALGVIAHSEDIRNDRFERLYGLLSSTRKSALSWTLVADYEGNGLLNTLLPYGAPLKRHSGDWAARVYDGQRPQVGGYFLGASSKRGVVSVNVPVPAAAGKRYVVTQIFDPRYFDIVFRRNALQPGWIVGVFDAKGISIARNRSPETFVGTPVRPELLAAVRRSGSGSGMLRHTTRDGIDVYDIFVRSAATGWTVAIGVPVAEIESAARLTTWYAGAALFLVLGLAAGIAMFFGRRLDHALGRATTAALGLAQGGVAPAAHSRLKEADLLLGALHRASTALADERTVRAALEHERESLLERERAARRQAEAQSEAKDHFISMLSHELRNPLAAISGGVAVIRSPNMPPAHVDKAWEIVGRQLRHLSRMVEDLLDVRRVLSGKVTLARERVDIASVLRACCDARSVATGGRHLWQVSAEDAWVLGDRTRLEQVVDNLLVNAMKFSPDGARIDVRNRVQDGTVVIEVADSGAGIDAELLPTIFEALVQGPTTLARTQGGLGLGLSIAKGLVQMHGGTIAAHSEGLGRGSVFTVRLPLCEHVAAPSHPPVTCP